jgi:hypothetical protein
VSKYNFSQTEIKEIYLGRGTINSFKVEVQLLPNGDEEDDEIELGKSTTSLNYSYK